MKSRFLTCIAAVTVCAALANPIPVAAQDKKDHKHHHYKLELIGTLGGTFSTPTAINDRGSVAGFSVLPGDSALHAFLWQKGEMSDLGTLGGPVSLAAQGPSLNARDTVVGFSNTSTPDPNGEDLCGVGTFLICLPFVWKEGAMIALPLLGGNNGLALGINNRGQIVGLAEGPNTDSCSPFALEVKPVIWRSGQIEQVLPPLGGSAAVANAINDNGNAVGQSGCVATGTFLAVLWRHGTVIDLGNLGGKQGNLATAINNRGSVVGQSDLPGDTTHHAFLWARGVMTDLGTLPGVPGSFATSINNLGQVVGYSDDFNGNTVALLWQNGMMSDLNTLVPPGSPLFLQEAWGINDGGEIAGFGLLSNGEQRGFLLTPCDKDHPGVEGCDYSMVEAPQASSASASTGPSLSLLPSINPMMLHQSSRAFGFGRRAMRAAPSPQAEETGKPSASTLPEELMPLKGDQAEFETPRCFRICHHGACEVNESTGKLTGYCIGPQPPYHQCAGGASKQCPVGKHAIKPGFTQCGEGPPSYIDFARACTF